LGRAGELWQGDGESDAESVDSEAEDGLKHAGVYTGEEVMRTMRDKLIRLQKLYIEQFGRLQHKLRESRRTYLAQVAPGITWHRDVTWPIYPLFERRTPLRPRLWPSESAGRTRRRAF